MPILVPYLYFFYCQMIRMIDVQMFHIPSEWIQSPLLSHH